MPRSKEEEAKLLGRIEQNFFALVLPWILTCGLPKEEIHFLEVGCGDGKYGHFISKWVRAYTGIDIRPCSLQAAAKLLASSPNSRIISGDGIRFNGVEDRSQHLVYSYQTFIHMPEVSVIEANVKEVVRVLSEDGIARIQLAGPMLRGGFRINWVALGSLQDSKLKRLLHRCLPADFLLPRPRRRKAENSWGRFAPPIHPAAAVEMVRRLGAYGRTSPSFYDFSYSGNEFGLYWLTITKKPDRHALVEKVR